MLLVGGRSPLISCSFQLMCPILSIHTPLQALRRSANARCSLLNLRFARLCDWVSARYTFDAAIQFSNRFNNCRAGQINTRLESYPFKGTGRSDPCKATGRSDPYKATGRYDPCKATVILIGSSHSRHVRVNNAVTVTETTASCIKPGLIY